MRSLLVRGPRSSFKQQPHCFQLDLGRRGGRVIVMGVEMSGRELLH